MHTMNPEKEQSNYDLGHDSREDIEKHSSIHTPDSDQLSTKSARENSDGNAIRPFRQQQIPLPQQRSAASIIFDKLTSRLTSPSFPDPGPPPDGGLVAWTQCFCAWLVIMNTWGFVNSFGAFQTYYTALLPDNSPSTISWIGSVQAFLTFFLGAFSGRALDAGYFMPTIVLGICFQLIGIFCMSFAKKYWQLFLTQGVLTGIGGGIFFCPTIGLVSTYFLKKRGLALGLATTGNSMGGIVYPLIVKQLLPKIGFGWTVRVIGFVNLASLSLIVIFMKPRLPPRKAGPIIEWTAIRDVPYVLFVFGASSLMASVYFVFYYIASFARDTIHIPYTSSVTLVIILNGVGLPARILPGFIADRFTGVLNLFVPIVLLNALLLFLWLTVHNITSLYVWTAWYGMAAGAIQSLFPTAVASLSQDLTRVGTRLGMGFSVVAFAALVGGPIGGAIVENYGGEYGAAILWAALGTLLGAGLVGGARVWKYGLLWRKC